MLQRSLARVGFVSDSKFAFIDEDVGFSADVVQAPRTICECVMNSLRCICREDRRRCLMFVTDCSSRETYR